jgi:predicted nucleotidyltransferase
MATLEGQKACPDSAHRDLAHGLPAAPAPRQKLPLPLEHGQLIKPCPQVTDAADGAPGNGFEKRPQPVVRMSPQRKTVKSREEIIQLLREAKPELADRFGVQRLAVFGSFARGEQGENSDIDILVEVDPSIGLRFVDLADELEKRLALKVDLVSRRAISPRNWEVLQKELIDVP